MSLNTRLVKVREIGANDERAWRELAGRALEPNPYFEPDFLGLSAKYFDSYAETTLVVAHERDTFRGVLPIVKFEKPRIPPRVIARIGTSPGGYRALGTPLLDAACPDLAADALLDALKGAAKERGWPGILFMDFVGSDGPVAESLLRACRTRGVPVFTKDSWERGRVHRGGRWEDPLTKSRARQVAKGRRGLLRDSGTELKLVDRTLDPSVVEEFVVMEAAGWKGKEGGWAFAKDPRKVAWFREWYERWAPTGRLVVLCLELGGEPVAFQFCVRAGDGVFLFREAYDETYSRYGPGAMIVADTMEYLLQHSDALWVDSGTDKGNAFLLEMLPEPRTLATLYLGTGGKLDRAVMTALPAMTRLATSARNLRQRMTKTRSTETDMVNA